MLVRPNVQRAKYEWCAKQPTIDHIPHCTLPHTRTYTQLYSYVSIVHIAAAAWHSYHTLYNMLEMIWRMQ